MINVGVRLEQILVQPCDREHFLVTYKLILRLRKKKVNIGKIQIYMEISSFEK